MSPTQSDPENTERGCSGLSRRQMIKAAGIAGAAAWSAPVIIDSLSSPAAAVTVPRGCYRLYSAANYGGAWQGWVGSQPGSTGPTCTPDTGGCASFGAFSPAIAAAVNLPSPSITDGGTQLVTVAVKSGYSCVIVAVSATVQRNSDDANACNTGVTFGATGGSSVTAKPNGSTFFSSTTWDARGGNTSMIGITIKCG